MDYLDLCEPNYQVSPTVYEFFNSLSAGFILITGIIGSAQLLDIKKKYAELNVFYYTLYFYILITIGIGKIFTHSLGMSQLSILYELPIIYCDVIILYKFTVNRYLRIFDSILGLYVLTVTICFVPIPHITIFLMYKLFIQVKVNTITKDYYLKNILFLLISLVLQNIEYLGCNSFTLYTYSIGNIFFALAYWHKIICILCLYNFKYNLDNIKNII
jgi:hypothetical protein